MNNGDSFVQTPGLKFAEPEKAVTVTPQKAVKEETANQDGLQFKPDTRPLWIDPSID
jgi:hypothetical protein